MFRALLFFYVLPILITGRIVDSDDEDTMSVPFCGVRDPYKVVRLELVMVDPQPIIAINGADVVDIKDSVFKKCGETSVLLMNDNRLVYLTGKRLEGLGKLKVLNLFDNFIEYIENGTFDELQDLQELELSYNRLNGITLGVRSGLGKLRKLHLNGNPIILGVDGFLGLPKLELLELSGANISTIPRGSFNGLNKLQRLDLSINNLTSVPEFSFKGLIQLEELDLSMNRIAKVSKDTFKGLVNLKYLWLNDNQIGSLMALDTFEYITNLKNLYLHRNPLVFLNVGVFKTMQNVQIEPGFAIEFLKNVKFNFFNETSSIYQCSQVGSQIGSRNVHSETIRQNLPMVTPSGYVENQYQDYYAAYYCVLLTTDESVEVKMI